MKTILIIIFASVLSVQINYAQWVRLDSGMGGADIRSFTVNGNRLFAGTSGNGIFVSTNNGTSWDLTFLGLWGRCFASLSANGNNIFVGTSGGPIGTDGVYLSTNNGTNWALTSLNNLFINALAVNGNSVFAGTDDYGAYFSTDNGTNWVQTGLNNRTILSLAVNGNNVYAGSLSYGLYISTNNGSSWTQSALNNVSVASIAVNGNNIFGGTLNNGVYYSDNNGASWIHTSLDTVTQVTSIIVSGSNVFAGSYFSGFCVSSDNGGNWIQRNEGFVYGVSLRILFLANNYVFAGTPAYGVFRRPISDIIGINTISSEIPKDFQLSQNYPNPFNPSTNIQFQVSITQFVELKVYDALSKEVCMLVNEQLKPGTYDVNWNAVDFPSGIYFYRLNAGIFLETKKMILIK